MKLNWAQPLIGMDLEECYIVFLPGHQLIYTSDIQFIRFRVIFYIFLNDYTLPSRSPLYPAAEEGQEGWGRLYQNIIRPISRMSLR